jgi:hypothetical protein
MGGALVLLVAMAGLGAATHPPTRPATHVATVEIFAPDTLLRWTRAPGLCRVLDAKPGGAVIQLVRLPRSFDYLTTQSWEGDICLDMQSSMPFSA